MWIRINPQQCFGITYNSGKSGSNLRPSNRRTFKLTVLGYSMEYYTEI